jgi:hypothetical protein
MLARIRPSEHLEPHARGPVGAGGTPVERSSASADADAEVLRVDPAGLPVGERRDVR